MCDAGTANFYESVGQINVLMPSALCTGALVTVWVATADGCGGGGGDHVVRAIDNAVGVD